MRRKTVYAGAPESTGSGRSGGTDGTRKPGRRRAGRSPVLDSIRGGLVVLMVIYHAAYIAVMSGLSSLQLFTGFWWIFPRVIAAGFVAVSGWNLAGKKARGGRFAEVLARAGRLALPALAITAVSAVMFRQGFVFFGILHLLAASSILAWPFLGRPRLALAGGLAVLAGGLLLGGARFDWPYLAWLGFRPAGLFPVDYLPLLPWFAWILFGAAARDLSSGLTKDSGTENGFSASVAMNPVSELTTGIPKQASASRATNRASAILSPLAFAGRHSLTIYLVHLPALYALALLLVFLTQG